MDTLSLYFSDTFCKPMFKFTMEGTRKATAKARLRFTDTEVMVNSFDIIHFFFYKLLLSNFSDSSMALSIV